VADEPNVLRPALRAMIAILVAMAFVAIYANVQRLRRDKLETVIVTAVPTPAPSPSASP
jgi:hypothetical protein